MQNGKWQESEIFGREGRVRRGNRMLAKENGVFLIKSWNSSFIPGANQEKHPWGKLGKGHCVMTVLRGQSNRCSGAASYGTVSKGYAVWTLRGHTGARRTATSPVRCPQATPQYLWGARSLPLTDASRLAKIPGWALSEQQEPSKGCATDFSFPVGIGERKTIFSSVFRSLSYSQQLEFIICFL